MDSLAARLGSLAASIVLGGLVLLASPGLLRSEPPTAAPASFAGSTLVEALVELQDRGLRLVFSDRVVDSALRVEHEPRDGSLVNVLAQLLEPHGLEARRSGTGWLVVVRSPPKAKPQPVPRVQSAERSEILRVTDAIVVTPKVQLPVHVLAGDEPVRGLDKDDFALWVGGRRQEILDVEVLDLEQTIGADERPIAELPAALRRHFMLVFDTGIESPAALRRARAFANEMVEGGLHPADLIGLATLSEVRKPQFALFFTSDRDAALTSIDAVTGRHPGELISDPLGIAVRPAHPTSGRRVVQKATRENPRGELKRLKEADRELTVAEWISDLEPAAERAERQAAVTRLLGLADSMFDLARTLRYAPGRKHIVFFSEGFDNSMLVGLGGANERERFRIEEMNRAAETGQLWKVDTDLRYGNGAAQSSFDSMLAEFTSSNSVIHAVDTRVDVDEGQSGRGHNGLADLARRTGGNYLRGDGDPAAVLEALDKRTSVTYLLSFAPPEKKRGGRSQRLRVRLRDGVEGRVLHPPGLPQATPAVDLSNEQRLLMAAGRIAGGRPGGDFPSKLTVGEVIGDGEESSVQVSVSVRGTHAPPGARPRSAEVYVYALTGTGEVVDNFVRSFYAAGGLPEDGSFEVEGRLRLVAGRYSLRSLVVYPDSGASSLASVELDVRTF